MIFQYIDMVLQPHYYLMPENFFRHQGFFLQHMMFFWISPSYANLKAYTNAIAWIYWWNMLTHQCRRKRSCFLIYSTKPLASYGMSSISHYLRMKPYQFLKLHLCPNIFTIVSRCYSYVPINCVIFPFLGSKFYYWISCFLSLFTKALVYFGIPIAI